MIIQNIIYEICLKHLAGQHNQKRHGWRYSRGGPYEAKLGSARRAMQSTPGKIDRDVYRKRAGMPGLSEIAATKKPYIAPAPKPKQEPQVQKPTKFATVEIDDYGNVSINTKGNYNADFVTEIKTIPKEFRSWNPKAKMWKVKKEMGETALEIAKKHYNFNQAEDKSSDITTVKTTVAKSKTKAGDFKKFDTDAHAMLNFSNNSDWAKWKKGLTYGEQSSISAYTGSAYDNINKHLRFDTPLSFGNANHINNLDSALAKGTLHENIMLFRGLRNDDMYHGANTKYQVGGIISDKGFGSTSTNPNFSKAWASSKTNPIYMRIKAPAGTHGGFFNIKDSSGSSLSTQGTKESEFLLPRDTKYSIDGISKEGNIVIYDVTIVQ